MPVLLKNPEAPATQRQLYKIRRLTGEDLRDKGITMQQASDIIQEWEGEVLPPPPPSGNQPFTEAHITLVEGDQGQGKSNTGTGMVVDAFYRDCIKIYCKEKDIIADVKGYDRKNRIARIKSNGAIKLLRIPQDYNLDSPMRIFCNYHLYGIPYVYIPSFAHLLKWLRIGLIVDGWLLVDEYYIGGNARDSMTAFGKELEKQAFQMRKMQLEVVILTPHARLIDKWIRVTPTKHIVCAYDEKRREITLTVREKGKKARVLPPYDATQYWGNYWTNERIIK